MNLRHELVNCFIVEGSDLEDFVNTHFPPATDTDPYNFQYAQDYPPDDSIVEFEVTAANSSGLRKIENALTSGIYDYQIIDKNYAILNFLCRKGLILPGKYMVRTGD